MKEVECICITYIKIGKQKIKTFQYEREKQKKVFLWMKLSMIPSKPFEWFHLEKTTHCFNIINLHIMLLCSNSHFVFLKFKIKFLTVWMVWHLSCTLSLLWIDNTLPLNLIMLNQSQGNENWYGSSWNASNRCLEDLTLHFHFVYIKVWQYLKLKIPWW